MATRLAASFSAAMTWRALSSGVPAGIMMRVTWARAATVESRTKQKNQRFMPHLLIVLEIVAPLRAGGKRKWALDAYIFIPQFRVLPDELLHQADAFVALHHVKRDAARAEQFF